MANILTKDGLGYAIIVRLPDYSVEMLLGSQSSEARLPIIFENVIMLSEVIASAKSHHIRINHQNVTVKNNIHTVCITWGDTNKNVCEFDIIELLTQIMPEKVRVYRENLERLARD